MFDYGLLWLDDTNRTFENKVIFAVARYRQKYGEAATVCYVHPSMLVNGKAVDIVGITVAPMSIVAPSNFWLGVDKPTQKRKKASE